MPQSPLLHLVVFAALAAPPLAGTEQPAQPAGSASSHESGEAWHLVDGATSEPGEVLAALHRLDGILLEAGALAEERATPAVKAFSREVTAAHRRLEERVLALAGELGVDPRAASEAVARASGLPSPVRRLQGVRGAAFDSAFLDLLVTETQRVVRTLEEEQREHRSAPGNRATKLAAEELPALQARSAAGQALWKELLARGSARRGPAPRRQKPREV